MGAKKLKTNGLYVVNRSMGGIFDRLNTINKRSLIIAAGLTGLILISVGILMLLDEDRPAETVIQSEQTVIASEYDRLAQQGLPETAVPEEVVAYYEALATRAADTNRFDEAVTAYESRRQFSPKSMDYLDYFTGAKYYCEVGDTTKARESLDRSQATMPAADDYEAGFYRDDFLGEIEYLRGRCGL